MCISPSTDNGAGKTCLDSRIKKCKPPYLFYFIKARRSGGGTTPACRAGRTPRPTAGASGVRARLPAPNSTALTSVPKTWRHGGCAISPSSTPSRACCASQKAQRRAAMAWFLVSTLGLLPPVPVCRSSTTARPYPILKIDLHVCDAQAIRPGGSQRSLPWKSSQGHARPPIPTLPYVDS